MSYPSIHGHLNEMGVTPETASEDQLHNAFIKAFQTDLPLGWAAVERLVNKLKDSGKERVMISLAPKSEEGQQYARLLGPDIPRQILSKYFGVAFGFYNCCGGVAGEDEKKLKMTMLEQVGAQHPNFVDC